VVVAHVGVLSKLGLVGVAEVLESVELVRPVMYVGFVWVGIFLGLWQGMLLYLYWRFRGVVER